MPAASRVTDPTLCRILYYDGEGNPYYVWEAREIATGEPRVKACGLSAARIGDTTTHPCSIVQGSSRVKVTGSPWAYVGCGLSCSGHITGGCSRVTVSS